MSLCKIGPTHEIQLRCSCGEPSYLRLEAWDADDPEPYVIGFSSPRLTLRSALRQWWHSRRCWSPSVALTRQQMVELRDGIDRLLAD